MKHFNQPIRLMHLKVMEFCLSSCANYVFTARAHKIVSSNAMIGFHGGSGSEEVSVGGSMKEEYDAMTASGKAAFQARLRREWQPQLNRETAVFKRIGVLQEGRLRMFGCRARFFL